MIRKLSIQQGQDSDTEILVDIVSHQMDVLTRYSTYVNELVSTRAYNNGINVNLKFRWTKGQTVVWEATLPDWENLSVLLHKMRPLVLRKEPTYFAKVLDIIQPTTPNESIDAFKAYYLSMFDGSSLQERFKLIANGVSLTSQRFFNQWLNSREYHRDVEKQAFVERLEKALPTDVTKAFFAYMVVDKLNAIVAVSGITDLLIGEIKGATFETR